MREMSRGSVGRKLKLTDNSYTTIPPLDEIVKTLHEEGIEVVYTDRLFLAGYHPVYNFNSWRYVTRSTLIKIYYEIKRGNT